MKLEFFIETLRSCSNPLGRPSKKFAFWLSAIINHSRVECRAKVWTPTGSSLFKSFVFSMVLYPTGLLRRRKWKEHTEVQSNILLTITFSTKWFSIVIKCWHNMWLKINNADTGDMCGPQFGSSSHEWYIFMSFSREKKHTSPIRMEIYWKIIGNKFISGNRWYKNKSCFITSNLNLNTMFIIVSRRIRTQNEYNLPSYRTPSKNGGNKKNKKMMRHSCYEAIKINNHKLSIKRYFFRFCGSFDNFCE